MQDSEVLKTGRPSPQPIRSVQALRAVAALFVVGFHATVLWHDRFDPASLPWQNGNAGVDLFFVISGFIMVVSSQRLQGVVLGWRRFIQLRLIRIVPMYWLTTAAKLAAIVAVPSMALHTRPTPWNIVASFLFIPSRDAAGTVRPVLDVGWTLSFEMLFYLAFAASLFLKIGQLSLLAPLMLALAFASLAIHPDWPAITTLADPIVLEFVFGVVLGQAALRGLPRIRALAWLLPVLAGLACLASVPAEGRWQRIAIWGVAASVTLYGCLLGEKRAGGKIPALAVRIGEASYSLYLTHGFVLPVLAIIGARAHFHGGMGEAALILLCLVVSTLTALAIFHFVEAPVTAWLRGLAHDRGRTTLAAPEAPI